MRVKLEQFKELGGVLPEAPPDHLDEISKRLDRLEEMLTYLPPPVTTSIVRDDTALLARLDRLEAKLAAAAPEYNFKVERDTKGKIVSVKASQASRPKHLYNQFN